MKENETNIEQIITDTLLEKPITFTLDGHFFYLYPPSIGVSMLSKSILEGFTLNKSLATLNSSLALIEAVETKKNDALRFIALHSFKDRELVLQEELVVKRIEELSGIKTPELIALCTAILDWNTWQDKISKHFALDKQQEKREKVSKAKEEDRNSITFGGKSVWGSLVDYACERYGWSTQYVMWGVSMLNLNLMMSDCVNSVYLTDKERKKLHISTDGVTINADDKKNIKQLRNIIKGK